MRRGATLLVGCAVLAACTHVSTRSYKVAAPSPPYEGRVQILVLGAPLPQSFQEVAVVQAQGSTEVDRLLPALQREAARLGCNAILHVRIHDGQATGMAVRIPRSRPASGD